MSPLFSAGIPSSQVKLIEANRDRIQEWYDKTPRFHAIDAQHRSGVKYPKYILCWETNKKTSMNTQEMDKDYRTHASSVSFIFWDVAPGHIQSCVLKINVSDNCLHCGEKGKLTTKANRISSLSTIPDSTSYYNIGSSVAFNAQYCPNCSKKFTYVLAAYQKDAQFLTVSLTAAMNTKAAYRAIAEKNAEIMVPYFKVLAWQQLPESTLLEVLKTYRH